MGLLPSEGERRAHTVSGCGTLPTGVWMQPQHQEWGKGKGMPVLHCRHLPGPPVPSTGIPLCSLAQVRGTRKRSVMESKETYFFFRSWEQRGQNLNTDTEEQGKQTVSEACRLSSTFSFGPSIQLLPQLSLTISLEAWLSAPHRQSGTTRWNTGKGRWNTAVRDPRRVEGNRATC